MASPSESAAAALDHALASPASLGAGRLICIDGPAGSGKTTIAAALAGLRPDATVVGTDHLLAGWRGLPGLAASIAELLTPLREGRPGSWRRWGWERGEWADSVTVPVTPLLVLEGVGSWARRYADLVTTLVWVEAERDVRLERWLARDGEAQRSFWADWLADEAALHEREGTRAAADLVVLT